MTASDTIDANRRTVARFLAGTHGPDLAGLAVIDETVSPAIVCHGFPGGDPVDRESYKAFFRTFRQAFDGMAFTTHVTVADEAFVAVRWRVEVDHVGAFAGVEPDGRRIGFDGMALYRMERGLIAETWLHIDELQLLAGIGAIPALAA